MKALLLSAYAAVSHRVWADGLMNAFPEVEWTRLELPPRHFAWSIRANPLIWQVTQEAALAQTYDLVVATSMVDLATLVGLCPALGRAHKVVYFHENQFAFPASAHQTPRPEPMMVNLYAALAADSVVFNSRYNRDSFCDGVRAFLARMPGRVCPATWLDGLAERAQLLPVPLPTMAQRPANGGHRIVWNHRWEYDKNPEAFFAALARLMEEEVAFEVAVMGQQFRNRPAIFDQARDWLGERVVCWGEQPSDVYARMLESSAIVVSTTDHEFQGLAIMEAVTRGCLPLVPDRLCFPDYYGDAYRYRGDSEALAMRLGQWLRHPEQRPALPDARAWQWPHWRDAYAAVLGLGVSA
ncbi:DUF3524 domain-containing protein [Salinicola endophyticus]|uniref:tRNA-queuosine alpha-mannosyltransferase n=1 Tax=Salinicola endophyticus TaxID=1949083 RepID=A0ABY8FKQ2_9GAMM|nr:DUF3524 domain-containing protein [Salinicola endophyticus]WFF43192.1 DUF3524 domain-containing protein [Salinicola endophyticus]